MKKRRHAPLHDSTKFSDPPAPDGKLSSWGQKQKQKQHIRGRVVHRGPGSSYQSRSKIYMQIYYSSLQHNITDEKLKTTWTSWEEQDEQWRPHVCCWGGAVACLQRELGVVFFPDFPALSASFHSSLNTSQRSITLLKLLS